MSQCVPSWDVDDANATPLARSASNSLGTDVVPSLDYEVAELTWENGQLAMHGLGTPRLSTKLLAADSLLKDAWEKPRAGGTLESIVSQATSMPRRKNGGELVPWFDPHQQLVGVENPGATSSATLTMDALVPCAKNSVPMRKWPGHEREPPAALVPGIRKGGVAGFSGHVGSCGGVPIAGSGAAAAAAHDWSNRGEHSVSGSATYGRDSMQVTTDTRRERELCTEGFTSTSLASPENTSSEKQCTMKSNDDNDQSVCHSRSQREIEMDEEDLKKKLNGKSSVSTKRSRAAATHNQSERKRRDKINQRMKTLQKMVPNSSKTDKASMLDEVIEYLKQLQAQVQMMSRMNMSPMMFPMAMQQQLQNLQMSMMAPAAAMGMNIGLGMGMMDMNNVAGRSNIAAALPQLLNPAAAAAAFMPMAAPWWENSADRMPPAATAASVMPDHLAAFLACQSQPGAAEAYSRMAALYQQFQQAPGVSKN